MGITITNSGFVQVTILYLMANGTTANTVNAYSYDGGGALTDSDDLLSAISTGWQLKADVLKNVMSNSVSIVGANCRVWNPATNLFDPIGLATFSAVGASTAPVTPAGNSGLGSCQTVNPRVDGLVYIPGISTSQLDPDGTFSGPGLINLLAAVASLYTSYTGAAGVAFAPVVFSKKNLAFFELFTYAASAVVAYQRRRKVGVGS